MVAERTIFETTTDLETYAVVERIYESRPARVLFSGQGHAAQSGIGLDDNPDLLFDYNQRFLEIANGLYPKRVLVLGGGAYTLPMALIAALPDVLVDVVELDAGLEAISRDYFGLETNDRLTLHVGDGRQYLQKSRQQYDLIIIDVFSELQIPEQFLTIEFVHMLQSHLTEQGCVALNIIASFQGKNAGLIKSQVAAYEALFTKVTLFPAAYGLTSWLPQNLVLVAEQQPFGDLTHYVRFAPVDSLATNADDIRHDG